MCVCSHRIIICMHTPGRILRMFKQQQQQSIHPTVLLLLLLWFPLVSSTLTYTHEANAQHISSMVVFVPLAYWKLDVWIFILGFIVVVVHKHTFTCGVCASTCKMEDNTLIRTQTHTHIVGKLKDWIYVRMLFLLLHFSLFYAQ